LTCPAFSKIASRVCFFWHLLCNIAHAWETIFRPEVRTCYFESI
jgi:hypothetical protein